jgi:hypothetical protein
MQTRVDAHVSVSPLPINACHNRFAALKAPSTLRWNVNDPAAVAVHCRANFDGCAFGVLENATIARLAASGDVEHGFVEDDATTIIDLKHRCRRLGQIGVIPKHAQRCQVCSHLPSVDQDASNADSLDPSDFTASKLIRDPSFQCRREKAENTNSGPTPHGRHIMLKVKRVLPFIGDIGGRRRLNTAIVAMIRRSTEKERASASGAVADSAYDALPIHFCNSASGTLRPCSGRI